VNYDGVKIIIPIRVRPWWARLLRLPDLFRAHYDILRRYNGRVASAKAAYRLSKQLMRIRSRAR